MDYEELEYIESVSTEYSGQYIDTDILATAVNGFETRCEVLDGCGNWATLVGNTTDDFTIGRCHVTGTTTKYIRIYDYEWTRDCAEQVIAYHGHRLTYDDADIPTSDNCVTLGRQATPIWLFNSTLAGRYGLGRIWYLRLYSDDTLVADMRPARRLTDNAIGMYDIVRKRFFENIGIGAFVAGEPTGRYF